MGYPTLIILSQHFSNLTLQKTVPHLVKRTMVSVYSHHPQRYCIEHIMVKPLLPSPVLGKIDLLVFDAKPVGQAVSVKDSQKTLECLV
jgi:hypothetical protein